MRSLLLTATLTSLLAASSAHAAIANGAPIALSPSSKLWLTGDSTLHAYKVNATQMTLTAHASAPAATLLELVQAKGVEGLVLTVPVAKLASGEKPMDENLQKAMKVAAQPNIVLTVSGYDVLPSSSAGAAMLVHLRGTLSIANVDRPVELNARVTVTPAGLRLAGSTALLMTAYGVTPPVLMAGMIKCKDEITAHFDVELTAI